MLVKLAAACEASAQAAPLAVSREETQHSSFLRTHATRTSFVGLGHVEGRCTGGTPLSLSRGCGTMRQLPPPRPSRLPRVMQVRAPALAVSGEEAQHSSLPRPPMR